MLYDELSSARAPFWPRSSLALPLVSLHAPVGARGGSGRGWTAAPRWSALCIRALPASPSGTELVNGQELHIEKLLEPRWLWAGRVMVGRMVVGAWEVRKDDRKPLASFAREPFGISLLFEFRGELEDKVGEDAGAWEVCKDD